MPSRAFKSVAVAGSLLMVALLSLPLLAQDQADQPKKECPMKAKMHADGAKAGCQGGDCAKDQAKHGGKMHAAGAKAITDALAAVNDAIAATESGEKDKALAELNKAKELLTGLHSKMMAMHAAKGKVINANCPIIGGKLDPANVPDNLIREYKGHKIGFCCAGCPEKWDALTEAEKDAKLKAMMPAVQDKAGCASGQCAEKGGK